MFDIALFVFFSVMSYRVCSGVYREAKIFREFRQTKTLAHVALLFPLGPLVMFSGPSRLGYPIAYVLASGCFIPALVVARRCGRALDVAGTDRVQQAQISVSQAFGTALLGLAYIGIAVALVFATLTMT